MPFNEDIPNAVKHAPLPRYKHSQNQLSFTQWLASVSYETRYAEYRAQGKEIARCALSDDADHHHCQLPDPVWNIREIFGHQYRVCTNLRAQREGALWRLDSVLGGISLLISNVPLRLVYEMHLMVA